ncbi:MAG TPA: hypothetical protein VFO06_01705 [Gemmatimonadales bacterium]|nr:hypothetical protein [Gemmatimonadales bacterium]
MRTRLIPGLLLLAACSSGTQTGTTAAPAPEGAAAAAAGVTAQGEATCTVPAGTQILNNQFSSSGERVTVMLVRGCLYHAETNQTGIQLVIEPRMPGTQRPYVAPLMGGGGVTGGQTFEIRPRSDGEFYVRATGMRAGNPVTLTITARGATEPPKE